MIQLGYLLSFKTQLFDILCAGDFITFGGLSPFRLLICVVIYLLVLEQFKPKVTDFKEELHRWSIDSSNKYRPFILK